MITLRPRAIRLVFATLAFIVAASLCPPPPALAGDFDAWGLVLVPARPSFADCESFDPTALVCEDGMWFDLGADRPLFLWLVAYHAFEFHSTDIAEIAVRIAVHPLDPKPTWTSCGWTETVAPPSWQWSRVFTPLEGTCVTPYVDEASYAAFTPLGYFELGAEVTSIDTEDGQWSYWKPCGSTQQYRPCSGMGAGYHVDDGNAYAYWYGCICAPATQAASWGRIKSEFER